VYERGQVSTGTRPQCVQRKGSGRVVNTDVSALRWEKAPGQKPGLRPRMKLQNFGAQAQGVRGALALTSMEVEGKR
jgi:hypothetical protein